MSKVIEITCDYCKKPINGDNSSSIAGGGELCSLVYQGRMGHNKFTSPFDYHYSCFTRVVDAIIRVNEGPAKGEGENTSE